MSFDVDDSRDHLVGFLRQLAPVLRAHRSETWGLDLTGCRYLGPFATAIIAALWEDARDAGVTPGIGLPRAPFELLGYCEFSGLNRLVRNGRAPDTTHPKCETVPLRFMTTASFNDPDPLVQLVRRHHAMTASSEDLLRQCVNEALQNVEDHSASRVGGVYTARFLENRAEVRVAVVDTGRGIASTLRGRYPAIDSDDGALRAVLQGDHSAKSTRRNLGLGISTMARIVRNAGGSFILVSGNAVREVTSQEGPSRHVILPVAFPGTAVFFTFPELNVDDTDDGSRDRV